MTKIHNNFYSTILFVISIILYFPSCGYLQESTKSIPSPTSNNSAKSTETGNEPNEPVVTKNTATVDITTITNTDNSVAQRKKNNTTLTDDQIAMSAEELLNDPDLISPLTTEGSSNYSDNEESDLDAEEVFGDLEEINFDDDFKIPDFAQKLLDESHPDYYPPTGKLFGFMRRHLLQRGDSAKPWTVTDDFNGDNKPDWAALMVNKNQQLDVIVIYSEDDTYRLEVLYEDAGVDNNSIKIELSQEKPGTKTGASYKNKPGQYRTATLEFPGINIMYYTKSSSLFYWHNYYFDELLTSK